MPSGKRLPPTRFPLSSRLAAALPLGTLFVGSGLVGLPTAAASVDPAAPVLTFTPATDMVESGQKAETTLVIAPGAEGNVCLFDLTLGGGFEIDSTVAQRPPATVEISGTVTKTTEVTATVTYVEVDEGAGCPPEPAEDAAQSRAQAPFVATVQEPTEEPTEEPTDDPSPSPTDEPTDGPSPTPSPTGSSSPPESPAPTGGSSNPPSPTSTGGNGENGNDDGSDENSGGSGDGGGSDSGGEGASGGSGNGSGGGGNGSGGGDGSGSGNGSGGSGADDYAGYDPAPPHSPVTTDRPGGGVADLPELPTGADAPDLPGLDSPSGGDPLAELPSVEPGEGGGGDDTSRTTEMAASEKAPTSMVTPAVLVLFLLLLLLFATPLAPSRRVRIGPSAYKGRRRRH